MKGTRFRYIADREVLAQEIAYLAFQAERQGQEELAAELYQEATELQELANEGSQYILLH